MKEVYDLKRARKYFNTNNSPVLCKRGNQEFIARYYCEAEIFYRSDTKSTAQLVLQKILTLEGDIKDCEEAINLAKNLSPQLIQQMLSTIKKTPDEVIKRKMDTIQTIQYEINKLITDYPEVEPLYIMHKIIK
jgi:hypothetical protein